MTDSYKETATPIDLQRQVQGKPAMSRSEAFAIITSDLKLVKGLSLQKVEMLARFLHSLVQNKDADVDENGVSLIKEATSAILENGDKNLIHSLVEVQRTIVRMFLDTKPGAGQDKGGVK